MIAKLLNIAPRTNRTQHVVLLMLEGAWRNFEDATLTPYSAFAQGVDYALSTGRLWGEADMKVRALTPYRLCKLADAAVAAGVRTQHDAVQFIREWAAQ